MVKSRRIDFTYRLQSRREFLGGEILDIECLASLDETIDALFEFLSKTDEQSLLEELCPYFGTIWPSARALAEEIATESLSGKRILELGCGLALPSLVAAKKGAKVLATDSHPDIESFLVRNLTSNSIEVEYRCLDWTANESLGKFDRVIASDVLYERQQPELVARTLLKHLAPQGRAILTDPGRPYLQNFCDEMRKLGYAPEISTRTVLDSLGDPPQKDVFILKFMT